MQKSKLKRNTLYAFALLGMNCTLVHATEINNYLSVYGFINGEVESVEAVGGATPYPSRGRIADGNSRIGFTGTIGINADAKAIWQIEGGLNNFAQGGVNDNGQSATLESRNTFVGVTSDKFGSLVIGNNDSVYRSLVGSGGALGGNLGMTVHGLDVFNNTSAQMTGNADSIFSRGETRMKNSIHYLSPELYGLQAGVSYGFDEAMVNRNNRSRYSLAVKYQYQALTIGVGYDHQSNTGLDATMLQTGFGTVIDAQANVNTTYAKVIASYVLPTKTTIGLGVERASIGNSQIQFPSSGSIYTSVYQNALTQNSYLFSVAQDVGDASLLAGYGKLSGLQGIQHYSADDFKAKQFSLALTYKLNSSLTPYVYVTKITNSAQSNINLGQSPVRSNALGTSAAFLAPGDSPRAIGIGLLARF